MPKKIKKRMILDREEFFLDDIDGMTLNSIIVKFEDLIDTYGDEATFDVSYDYDNLDCKIYFEREEREDERKKRLAKNAKCRKDNKAAKVKKDEEDLILFEKLKKKFEKGE